MLIKITKVRVTTIDEVSILHFRNALNLKSTEIYNLNVNLILGKKFKATTICLPFNEKPNEKYLDMDVTIAGWGFTKIKKDFYGEDAGKLLL